MFFLIIPMLVIYSKFEVTGSTLVVEGGENYDRGNFTGKK
jgi:hypothetical protein